MAIIPSPRTWTNGEDVLETYLDTELRDGWRFFTNPPRVKVYNTTGQTLAASAGGTNHTLLTWDTDIYDTDGMHNPSSNPSRLTAVTSGAYQVVLHINWAIDNSVSTSTLGPGNRFSSVHLNDTTNADPTVNPTFQVGTDIAHILPSDGLGPQTSHIEFQRFFTAGDYITAAVTTSSTQSVSTIVSGQAARSWFAMRWIGTT